MLYILENRKPKIENKNYLFAKNLGNRYHVDLTNAMRNI